MSVWSRIGQFFGARNERELVMSPAQYGVRWLPVYEAGTTLTVDEALHVSTVWACMDWLVRCIAPRPWNVYDVNGDRRTLLSTGPLPYMLNTRPNPEMTAIALKEALLFSALGFGNGYAEITRDTMGRVSELWPLEPDRVVPWRKETTDECGREGELGYRVMQFSGGQVWVPAGRIFHLRGPASWNGVSGFNLLVIAARSIAISAAAQQFSASYFRNGSVLTGVLETDKVIRDQKVIDNIRAQWVERYAGPLNGGKPLVLPEGLKWKEIAGDPNKAQLLETRKFQVEEICRYFGVPLHAIGVQSGAHGYGSNIEQMGIEAVRTCLRPWAERLEQEADFKLLPQRGNRETKIDLSELTMGDLKSQVDAYGAGVTNGLWTLNEAREHFGKNNIGPDGDVHFLPSTAKTLEQIIEPPAPPAPVAPPPLPKLKPEKPGTPDNTRKAVALACAQSLTRYARALKSRAEAVAGREDAAAKVSAERERLRKFLVEECGAALALVSAADATEQIGKVAETVEQGEPPGLAAERIIDESDRNIPPLPEQREEAA